MLNRNQATRCNVMPQLTPPQRAKIAELRFRGLSVAKALKVFNDLYPESPTSRPTLSRWYDRANTQFVKEGSLHRVKGSGRPTLFNHFQTKKLQIELERDFATTSKLAKSHGVHRYTSTAQSNRQSGSKTPEGSHCGPHRQSTNCARSYHQEERQTNEVLRCLKEKY